MTNSIRISSNWTLILSLFIPTFWVVFFGLLTAAILLSDEYSLPFPTVPYIRWIIFACFLFFLLLIYKTIMRLKRVELSSTHFFVSNFFKTYKYPLQDILEISHTDFLIKKLVLIRLKQKGKFGDKIYFLLNQAQLNYYQEQTKVEVFSEVLD